MARIRYANGEQGIELLTGQRIKYKARSGGSGRGFAQADLIVYDEAQHLQAEHVAASGPARLANPNNQSWYMGSGGLGTSRNAWRMRRRALAGEGGRFAYVEHTAEEVTLDHRGRVVSVKPDVLDREAWARANSAYGHRITDESMLSLYQELGPELFARECLCVWDLELGGEVEGDIPRATWDLVNAPDVAPVGSLVLVPDVNPERSASAVVAVGGAVVEVVEHRPGVGWLVDRCKELAGRHEGAVWAVDGAKRAPIAALIPDLNEAGLTPTLVGTDMAAACGSMYDAIVDRKVTFRRHPSMDSAVAGAVRKVSGEWDRLAGADISPLVAATVGLWVSGAVTEADFFTI